MRTAVVGHVEWVEFARLERMPSSGDILHALEWWEEPAGGGSVAAVQLQKLAGDCIFFTALGKDAVGKRAHLELEALGPQVEAARRNAPTRRAVTLIDPNGERTITTLGERLQPGSADPLPWDELARADAAYFTAGDLGALAAARRARVLVGTSRAFGVLAQADFPLDALVGSGRNPSERFDPRALKHVPRLSVLTDGTDGGVWATADGRRGTFRAARPSGPVVDTYGVGDCFAAGLTYALAARCGIEDALRLAARCGAACVAGRGPYSSQLTAAELRQSSSRGG